MNQKLGNSSPAGLPGHETQSIGWCFEQQALLHADKPAVRTESASLSYAGLDSLANSIAEEIVRRTATTKNRIALLLEHDAPLIAAILGVLKSGNIFFVLDHDYPLQQIHYVVDDASAAIVITDAANREMAGRLDRDWEVINIDVLDDRSDKTEMAVITDPDAIAYLMYTSGSTGKPKGVMQTHRNLLHHIRNYSRGLDITEDDRLTLFYSCSFSASLMDIFGALLNGATLYPYYLKTRSLERLHEWLARERITVFHSIPGVFRRLCLAAGESGIFPDLRIIDVAGEPLYQTDMELFRAVFPIDCRLVNHLACTEASVVAQYRMDAQTPVDGKIVPVGYPAEGIRLSVINVDGYAAKLGETGELVIESDYLSPGYWNREVADKGMGTDKRSGPAAGVFHTGDLGVMQADGCFTHLGRIGSRVKIRGHSIELAQVEAALRGHTSVRDAAIISRQQLHDQSCLVAYYVERAGTVINGRVLRNYLQRELPHYMVPSFFIALEDLPVMPNGKLNRKALPDVDRSLLQLDTPFLEPRKPLELRLQGIWERVLGLSPIGLDDTFVDLGGNSLMMASLLIEVEREFSLRIPLSSGLETLTIDKLARMLDDPSEGFNWRPLVPFRVQGNKPPVFCVHGAGDSILGLQLLANHMDSQRPFYALQPSGLDGKTAVHKRVEDCAACYREEILTVQSSGPFFLMGYSYGGLVAYEIAQQLCEQGKEIAIVVLLDPPLFPGEEIITAQVGRHAETQRVSRTLKKLLHYSYRLWEWPEIAKRLMKDRVRSILERPLPMKERYNIFYDTALSSTRNYQPRPYSGKLLLIESSLENREAWEKLAHGQLLVHKIDCEHSVLLKLPHVEEVSRLIGEDLERC